MWLLAGARGPLCYGLSFSAAADAAEGRLVLGGNAGAPCGRRNGKTWAVEQDAVPENTGFFGAGLSHKKGRSAAAGPFVLHGFSTKDKGRIVSGLAV